VNQDFDKEISEFTEKQSQALRSCLKEISEGQDYKAAKSALVGAIRSEDAYTRKHDATKTLKMFLKNQKVPLERTENDRVRRTDVSENE
jgi:N-acetyl-anhydromuramyl-L-alanine amidase AmpD